MNQPTLPTPNVSSLVDPPGHRTLGLFGATGVGVGAIVGGGILALAGTAFATTGPSAVLAFILNGLIALMTALTFAEMATSFPESGGTYTFAKKVLSVEAAFMVGWVVWFASIMAAVLYALGFGAFRWHLPRTTVARCRQRTPFLVGRSYAGNPPGPSSHGFLCRTTGEEQFRRWQLGDRGQDGGLPGSHPRRSVGPGNEAR